MFSQRGVFNLGHSLQDMRDIERRVNANLLNEIDAQVLSAAEVKARIPVIDASSGARYPIMGASFQPRGGVARHAAVAWGFARAASHRQDAGQGPVLQLRLGHGRLQGQPPLVAQQPDGA
jgi:sarcosine oxidase subunit beta